MINLGTGPDNNNQNKDDNTIMKTIKLIIIGVLLLVSSGCFPIFIPDEGPRGGHHEGHGRGDHNDGDRREHLDH